MRGHFRPPALPEECLVFLPFVGRWKNIKAKTFVQPFAKQNFREPHRESFADGLNNI